MKVMVCIPLEVSVETTKRKEMKDAVAAALIKAHVTNQDGTEVRVTGLQMLMPNITSGRFLVRAPEKIPGFDE